MPATAAYNFIGLPDKILPSEMESYHKDLMGEDESRAHQAMATYLAEQGKYSGSIELDMETLMPMYIGGGEDEAGFFAPAGQKRIPGSSIRGMVKNLVKIITCGSMRGKEDVNDRHIYFRCLMAPNNSPDWMKDLHKLYSNRMMRIVNKKPVKNAKTGFLLQDKQGNYMVAPLLTGKNTRRILIREYEDTFNTSVPVRGASVAWHDDEAYIITGSQSRNRLKPNMRAYEAVPQEQRKRLGKQFIRYVNLRDADWNENHFLPVPDEVIKDYVEDVTRGGVDLLNDKGRLKDEVVRDKGIKVPGNIVTVIPCGYLEQDKEVSAFGHGQCFRIPYKTGILDAIPKALQKDTIDIATAIFGNKEKWAGRVFFEDALPEGAIESLETAYAHPLLQPKPTSYQLYLKQQRGKKLNHWDAAGAEVRGYKLYWHNNKSDWQASPDEEKMTNVVRRITPIKKGSKFTSRIRFQNLTAVELGALLMVFDMSGNGEKVAYKIGQGKSLGLGSLKMTGKLYLEGEDYYANLFADGQLNDQGKPADGEKFLKEFEAYVEKAGMSRQWQEIMKELTAMLDWQKVQNTKGWSNRVASMSGNVQSGEVDERFKTRDILPKVSEVYGN